MLNQNQTPHGHTTVHSGFPSQSAGLQACDYLLWALQSFHERQHERFPHSMWQKFVRVLDQDAPAPKTKGKPTFVAQRMNITAGP